MIKKNLAELDLKSVYRTGTDDLYNDFYKKVLSVSNSYDRAVGYFSSQLLIMSTRGLSNLVSIGGKIRLIIGHPLSEDEFTAVQQGYLLKDMSERLSGQLEELLCGQEKNDRRLELLAWLIACGHLEIRFAVRKAGMYHEKIGVFRDAEGNSVVFQGSANETPHGMMASLNAESISVYKSWNPEVFELYGKEYIDGFESLWDNKQANTITLELTADAYLKISEKSKDAVFDPKIVDDIEGLFQEEMDKRKLSPCIPEKIGSKEFNIYEHQRNALQSWMGHSYKGILKLATGSGKTITSIYGAVKVYEARKKEGQSLALIISVPYVELALQWIENLKFFNITAIECFDSRIKWSEELTNKVSFFNAGVIDFMCVVVVNRTLSGEHFTSLISKINSSSMMMIGDECHRHGANDVNKSLPDAFYRIGLSATPFRSDDDEIETPFPDEARKRLEAYYGGVVAEYSLGDAINDDVLTPYEYHLVPVYLTAEEQEEYDEISLKISNILASTHGSKVSKNDSDNLTRLCGQRSRLLGRAKNKLIRLSELTKGIDSGNRKNTLFYAGEGQAFLDDLDDLDEDVAVIDQVSSVLYENGWDVAQFTGAVGKSERKTIMDAFKNKDVDALVAMKVLDEGIDVPACETAYILASTKNPRQYVQRRGRILRKAEGKELAKIYDFVVLPSGDSRFSKRLLESEAERVNDFTNLAINKLEIEWKMEELGLNYV